jgi:hypothetical protein
MSRVPGTSSSGLPITDSGEHPALRAVGSQEASWCHDAASFLRIDSLQALQYDFASFHAHLTKGMPMPRGERGLSVEQLKEMAKQGAEEALKHLRAEIIAIERTFPELALPKHRRAFRQKLRAAAPLARRMSAAARKVVPERMKKYCTKPLRGRYHSHQALIAA